MRHEKKLTSNPDRRARHRARRQQYLGTRAGAASVKERCLRHALETTSAELIDAEGRRDQLEQEAKSLGDQMKRLAAEFDNFRKRVQKEKDDLKKFASQGFIEALIPVLDSFDQAQSALNATHDVRGLVDGFKAIQSQMTNALKCQGFEKIEAEQGKPFDPNFHEALAVVKTDQDAQNNTIYDVLQNGYMLNGRLVRAARVRIAQKG